jgi:hypothetical protein
VADGLLKVKSEIDTVRRWIWVKNKRKVCQKIIWFCQLSKCKWKSNRCKVAKWKCRVYFQWMDNSAQTTSPLAVYFKQPTISESRYGISIFATASSSAHLLLVAFQ